MSDYVIRARFVVSDESATGVGGATQRVEGLRSSIFSLGGTLTRVLGALGVSVGLGQFARGVIGLNSELQQANVGMATLLSANYGMRGVEALGLAKSIVGDLRKDAAAGVGELADYMGGFQTIMGPGLRTGASLQQLRELTRNALTAGNALRGQEGMSLATFDVQQALGGQVGERTTPIVMQALGAAGITSEAFRKLRPEERVGALNRAFATFAEGAKLMGQTWDAQASTFKDQLKELARTATSPLFDRWSDQLRGANEWLVKNQDRLEIIAGRVGDKLVALWDHLVKQAGTYAMLAGTAMVAPAIGAATRGGAGAVGLGGLSGLVLGAVKGAWTWLASSVGSIGSAAMWGANLPGRVGLFGRLAGGGAAALGETGAIFAPFLQILGKLAVPLAIVTTAFMAIKGALVEFQRPTRFVKEQWAALKGSLSTFGDTFLLIGEALGLWTGQGSVLNLVGAALVATFGGVIWVLDVVVQVADKLTRVLGVLALGFGYVLRMAGTAFKFLLEGNIRGISVVSEQIKQETVGMLGPMLFAALRYKSPGAGVPEPPPIDNKDTNNNNTNIYGDVNIHINTKAGHREIAGAFDLLIERTNRYRRQAVRPAWSTG